MGIGSVEDPGLRVASDLDDGQVSKADLRLLHAALRGHVEDIAAAATAVGSVIAGAVDSPRAAIAAMARRTVPRWHFAMLNDTERNDAFLVALERQVRPGMLVLDIGAGTGLLAMLAARCGASHVITCEANPLLAEIARQVVAAHGLADRITVVSKSSTNLVVGVDLPRRADLIVSETMDCGLVGEGALSTLRHAREHLLVPGGVAVPGGVRLFGFLIDSPVVDGLNRVGTAAGFDVRLFNIAATHGHFPVRLRTWPHRVLSDTVELVRFDLAAGRLDDGSARVPLTAVAAGLAHALVAWFEMDLGAGVVIRNSPENLGSHWMQALVPLPTPVPTRPGERLQVDLAWRQEQLLANVSPTSAEVEQ